MLTPPPDPNPVKSYYIQHVQTGEEFRSSQRDDVNRWMADMNHRYLAEVLSRAQGAPGNGQEDVQ